MSKPKGVEVTSGKAQHGAERRKQLRFPCSGFAEVVLDDAAFLFRGTVRDLSLSGCYVQSSARLVLDSGTTVELKFSVNSDELLMPARIVVIRPGAGAGFEFLEADAYMRSRLTSLIDKLGNPTADVQTVVASNGSGSDVGAGDARDLWHPRR